MQSTHIIVSNTYNALNNYIINLKYNIPRVSVITLVPAHNDGIRIIIVL